MRARRQSVAEITIVVAAKVHCRRRVRIFANTICSCCLPEQASKPLARDERLCAERQYRFQFANEPYRVLHSQTNQCRRIAWEASAQVVGSLCNWLAKPACRTGSASRASLPEFGCCEPSSLLATSCRSCRARLLGAPRTAELGHVSSLVRPKPATDCRKPSRDSDGCRAIQLCIRRRARRTAAEEASHIRMVSEVAHRSSRLVWRTESAGKRL